MKLVIVESPAKATTIEKFLGPKYRVLSSYGHVRDLPKSTLGVDVENNFEPKYIIPTKARKNLNILKKEAQKSDSVILATDEDREGEAIAWHLFSALNLNEDNYQRIVFHEITKQAISDALDNPRKIDINLVDSQQARRILDRIVGYKLSPFLWKKVARGLSAGRVQSATVRLIIEREKEIQSFTPKEYWTIIATLLSLKAKNENLKIQEFEANLLKKDGKSITKLEIKNQKEVDNIIKDLESAQYQIENVKKEELKRNPPFPFTTSSLQQTAWKKFHWTAKSTMRQAQTLYEKGFITYHRTDSVNLSQLALIDAKKFIIENLGQNYWAGFFRKYKTKNRAQEAHEAIRPTFAKNSPETLQNKLDKNQLKLYELIWSRTIASQMNQAIFNSIMADIKARNYTFRANGQTLKFDGFLKIYPIKFEEKKLPDLEKNQLLELIKLTPFQHFTKPPARYSEASLIKALEDNEIGRPSTYAAIISTIQGRNYVIKNETKQFQPTEIGTMVNNLLVEHFPKIVDIGFTAQLEKDLDKIASGEEKWIPIIKNFYDPFEENLKKKEKEIAKKEVVVEKTDKICPDCGSPIIIRFGRFGKFYACSGFPKCKHTEPLEKEMLNIKCPQCQKGDLVTKKTRKGKIFYACNQYPNCEFALWDKPTGEKCQECDSLLMQNKKGQTKCSNKECDYDKKRK
ncbi:MAG: type I DNA topoisomerase [Patescibacteria group bacterium]